MTAEFLVKYLGVAVAILTSIIALLAVVFAVLGFWGYRELKNTLKAAKTDAEKAAMDHVYFSIKEGEINRLIVREVAGEARKAVVDKIVSENKRKENLDKEEAGG